MHGKNPRHGSMQFWPRRRAKKNHSRIRAWPGTQGALGFAGYKVGMTHLIVVENRPTTENKGHEIAFPATIIECPPLKVAAVRFYKTVTYGPQPSSQVFADNIDKTVARSICLPKKQAKKLEDVTDFEDARLIVYTQPSLTGIGKKKPELFEIPIGGKKEDKIKYAKEKLGKEITIEEVFKEGEQLDAHSITKGKGFQGPVKRFGIGMKSHKSEKQRRNPGSLGGWSAQGHTMYRVAHAGQMGYHQRTEYNKQLLKISKDTNAIQQKGGFMHYGTIRNPYVIIKGSIGGACKRLVTFSHAIRPNHLIPKEAPQIVYISQESKQ